MKIALVVHDFSRRFGHGRYTVELATRFARDHDVHVFANTVDAADAGSTRIHLVPALRANALSTILSFPFPATTRIGSDWDIVHAQGVTVARFNVITAHICNAGWAHAQRDARVARTWRQRTFETVVTAIERATYRRSPHAEVIAISNRLKGELDMYYGRRERVSVIHHGVDTSRFVPTSDHARRELRSALALPDDRPIALYVGDLRKGGAVAIDVLARVESMQLVMVSNSDPAPYIAHARASGVSNRASFHPGVRDIQRYYGAADLFLFPSPYDAFGMVVSEAMACGLPVIASRQTGAAELLHHGVDGFVVEHADDADTFATHAARLVRDASLRVMLGTAARAAAERHTWDDVARETMTIYERASPLR